MTDFQCEEAAIPRVFVNLENPGGNPGPRTELKIDIHAESKLRITIEMITGQDEMRETIPRGLYQAALLLRPKPASVPSRLKEIKVPVTVERK